MVYGKAQNQTRKEDLRKMIDFITKLEALFVQCDVDWSIDYNPVDKHYYITIDGDTVRLEKVVYNA